MSRAVADEQEDLPESIAWLDEVTTQPEAWEALVRQHAEGKPAPDGPSEFTLPLAEITLRPEVFQYRSPAKHASEAHVRELAAVAKERRLEPLDVWWDGQGWTCIDGHHRCAAYKKAGTLTGIPVRVFKGTPEEASLQAIKGNSRAKLQMSSSERTEAAWRAVFTLGETVSKKDTAGATAVSERTIANMRRVRRLILEAGKDPAGMTWRNAQRVAQGQEPAGPGEWDEEKEAQEMANKLLQTFGPLKPHLFETLAKALEIYSPTLPEQLAEVWGFGQDNEGDW